MLYMEKAQCNMLCMFTIPCMHYSLFCFMIFLIFGRYHHYISNFFTFTEFVNSLLLSLFHNHFYCLCFFKNKYILIHRQAYPKTNRRSFQALIYFIFFIILFLFIILSYQWLIHVFPPNFVTRRNRQNYGEFKIFLLFRLKFFYYTWQKCSRYQFFKVKLHTTQTLSTLII